MSKTLPSLNDIQIPDNIKNIDAIGDEAAAMARENLLLSWFSDNYALFTPFPKYFTTRCYELRILRQLLPAYFNLESKYEILLEIGCGFGFNVLLLAPYCRKIVGVDIPETYRGYVLGDFKTSVEIASLLINEKFEMKNAEFKACYPHKTQMEDNSISAIFSGYVLEHIPNLSEACVEMRRILKTGGVMIHTVPITTDAVLKFIDANTNISFRRLIHMGKRFAGKLLGLVSSGYEISINGTISPPCHSEFADSFAKQIEIYTLENYLFKMVEAGFKIETIISTREHNKVVVARKI